MVVVAMCFGMILGFVIARNPGSFALADESNTTTGDNTPVNHDTLEQIYQAAFGRPADTEGLQFHVGKPLQQVLHDINNSDEKVYYGALFKAVKSYEEAVRAPGDLSAADKQKYLDNINSALATLLAWVETLPSRPICDGAVGPEEARQAIMEAYNKMSSAAQANAEHGIFDATDHIGPPANIQLPVMRCLQKPTPTITPIKTCLPRPLCLDAEPRCMIPEPMGGWCPRPSWSPVACTADAKICPDGSSVGRTGPNCEFKVCPTHTPTPTVTPTITPSSTQNI